ncbi:MAG: ABC-2 transporter permease [Ruminococcus sp.]|nr:ABC-2 transporter permease [Ruminococcus sp.]
MQKGLCIKEIKQYGVLVFMPLIYSALIVPFTWYFLEVYIFGNAAAAAIGAVILSFVAAAILQTIIIRDVRNKMWGYFVCSTSAGHKGYLLTKYCFVLACALFNLVGTAAACTIYAGLTNTSDVISLRFTCKLTLILFSVQLFMRAADIPLTVRFGEKKGSIVRLIAVIAMIICCTVLVIIIPEAGSVFTKLKNIISSSSGEVWFLPTLAGISTAAYVLSYFISCRVYIKSLENVE